MKKLSLLAVSVLLLSACGEETGTNKETPVEDTGSATEQADEVTETEEKNNDAEAAEETEEKTEEKTDAEYGKRSNPVPVGQAQTVDIAIHDNDFNSYEAKAEITVNSVQRGQEVWEFAQGINQFNEAPAEGYEYIMLDVTANLSEADTEDYAWWVSSMQFDFIGSDGSPYETTSVVIEPELSGEIFVGGSTQGYVINMVKTDDPILIVFEDANWDNVFFATE